MRARSRPELIRWVRSNAGFSVADAAEKAGTSEAIARQWEDLKDRGQRPQESPVEIFWPLGL